MMAENEKDDECVSADSFALISREMRAPIIIMRNVRHKFLELPKNKEYSTDETWPRYAGGLLMCSVYCLSIGGQQHATIAITFSTFFTSHSLVSSHFYCFIS